MPAIHQDRQLDPLRTSEIHEGVHRRADRPSREEHVVHQDDRPTPDVERDPRLVNFRRLGLQTDVIPVERDVQGPDGHLGALDLRDLGGQAAREVISAVRDPDERQITCALVAFHDLVGDAGESPADIRRVQDLRAHRPTHRNALPRRHGRALRLCRISRSLPGLTGPDLKGRSLTEG